MRLLQHENESTYTRCCYLPTLTLLDPIEASKSIGDSSLLLPPTATDLVVERAESGLFSSAAAAARVTLRDRSVLVISLPSALQRYAVPVSLGAHLKKGRLRESR